MPLLQSKKGETRKIALIDLEEMGSAHAGLFGMGLFRRGLIRCVNEKLGEVVIQEAKNHFEWDNGLEQMSKNALDQRKQELEKARQVESYHVTRKITNGDEEVTVDLGSLGFSEDLRQIAETIIDEMNQDILTKVNTVDILARRKVEIRTGHRNTPLYQADSKSLEGKDCSFEESSLKQVLGKLVEQGAIFGYFCQCPGRISLQA